MKKDEHLELTPLSSALVAKTIKDPPSRNEIYAEGSRAAAEARARAKMNIPVHSPKSSQKATSSALNLIEETLEGDEFLAQTRVSYIPGQVAAVTTVDHTHANSTIEGKNYVATEPPPYKGMGVSARARPPPVLDVNKTTSNTAELGLKTSTMENIFKRLQAGFRVHAYLTALSSAPERCILHLDESRTNLCISEVDERGEKKNPGYNRSIMIPMDNVFKLEFGRAGPNGKMLHPMTSFSLAIESGDGLTYFDFEATTPTERELVVSSLMILLEALYSRSDIRQDRFSKSVDREESRDGIDTGTRRSLEVEVEDLENDTLGKVIYDDTDLEENGTSVQPIPCSPSLEESVVQYANPSESTYFKQAEVPQELDTNAARAFTFESRDQMNWSGNLNRADHGPIENDEVGPVYSSSVEERFKGSDSNQTRRFSRSEDHMVYYKEVQTMGSSVSEPIDAEELAIQRPKQREDIPTPTRKFYDGEKSSFTQEMEQRNEEPIDLVESPDIHNDLQEFHASQNGFMETPPTSRAHSYSQRLSSFPTRHSEDIVAPNLHPVAIAGGTPVKQRGQGGLESHSETHGGNNGDVAPRRHETRPPAGHGLGAVAGRQERVSQRVFQAQGGPFWRRNGHLMRVQEEEEAFTVIQHTSSSGHVTTRESVSSTLQHATELLQRQDSARIGKLTKQPEIEYAGSGRLYPASNSFSENSTVACSNVRRASPRSRSTKSIGAPISGSSPAEPIIIEEGFDLVENQEEYYSEVGRDASHPHQLENMSIDDNQSCGTHDTGFGAQAESKFMSFINSKSKLDIGARSPQQNYEMGWCSDDVCTTTLNDMAQTCSGMFAIEQGKHTLMPLSCSDYSCPEPSSMGQVSCTYTSQPSCIDPNLTEEQMAVVEEYVKNALGAPSAMYAYFVEDPIDGERVVKMEKHKQNEPISQRMKNRATRRNAQAGRLRNLRKEMTFASALKQSREHMRTIKTTQSFNDAQPRRGFTDKAANQFLGSDLLSSVVHTMGTGNVQPTEAAEQEEEAYYDSDPEDTRERTLHRGPRRVSADIDNVRERQVQKMESPGLGKIRNKLSRRVDEDLVKEIVQVMQNDRLTLMWHPTQSKSAPNRSPTLVRLWIESGLQLIDGSFLLPKLTWTKASEEGGFKTGKLHKTDLLDICRIRANDRIDREKHPFASKRVSFVIETQADAYLFEAETTEERDRVVYGLKVVVARLASLLMLRDYRAAEEFFGSPANMVPGQSPI